MTPFLIPQLVSLRPMSLIAFKDKLLTYLVLQLQLLLLVHPPQHHHLPPPKQQQEEEEQGKKEKEEEEEELASQLLA